MRQLVLIKHAAPEINPSIPAAEWQLSEAGQAACPALAERLRGFSPQIILSSVEPKARETARLIGVELGVTVEAVAGLHEHDRHNVPFLPDDEFRAAVARFFERPNDLVFGREAATRALERFALAIDESIARFASGDLIVVCHGTVISLFVAARTGCDPYSLWQRLGMPSFVVLSLPALEMVGVVATIDSQER